MVRFRAPLQRVGNHEGIDATQLRANARVSKQVFAESVVDPLLLRNYTQLTHELSRICWRLGTAVLTSSLSAEQVKVQAGADDIQLTAS